ncbi:alpha/beta hydrolase [Parasphingorhabdus halotolerans]|uniref:Alpha/beta hydrolase n=2 Tax=Parasphingorhabdus halotolerans TaxID=2725558 RepID=A0A6H2DRX6_9SPHN|nr:alpha/beta hydrolase [Parasphingorhabdus halotolerans]
MVKRVLRARVFIWLALPFFASGCITPVEYGDVRHIDYIDNARCQPEAKSDGTFIDQPYFVVTSRLPDCRTERVTLLNHRSDIIRYGRFAAPQEMAVTSAKGKTKNVTAIPFSLSNNQQWWDDLSREAQQHDGRILLYVHGFKETFFTSARDSAQISRLSGLDIPMVHYSWPSQGALLKYATDETNMYYNERQFRGFLTRLAQQPWTKEIILVAHSLGARLVIPAVEFVDRNSSSEDSSNISNIILASPDVDRQDFERDIAETVLTTRRVNNDRRITVYASAKDRALGASYNIHGYPRLGRPDCFDPFEAAALKEKGLPERCYASKTKYDTPPEKSGLTIIDTTEVSRGRTGHSDYLTSAAACTDFMAIINGERNRTTGREETRLSHVFALSPVPKDKRPDDSIVCRRDRN